MSKNENKNTNASKEPSQSCAGVSSANADEIISILEHALIKACYMWATAEYDEDISKSESLLEWGGWRKYDNLKQLFIYLKDDAIPIPAAIQEWVDKLTCKETG